MTTSSRTSSRQRLLGLFSDVEEAEQSSLANPTAGNILLRHFTVTQPPEADTEHEDVSVDLTRLIADGNIHSRLAWADFYRNVRILNEITATEPPLVLELGCGNHHPVGRMIAGAELSTTYVGMDYSYDRAYAVTAENGRKPFVGVHVDLSMGIPMSVNSAAFVLCLEAMEHFCEDITDVRQLFDEVARVMMDGGAFYLATPNPAGGPVLHPDCHDNEFDAIDVLDVADAAGFHCTFHYLYRTKGPWLKKLLRRTVRGMPSEAVIAYELPDVTLGKLDIPGNILFKFVRKQ